MVVVVVAMDNVDCTDSLADLLETTTKLRNKNRKHSKAVREEMVIIFRRKEYGAGLFSIRRVRGW